MEKEKYALITGATSGIGEACAKRFAKEGYQLILTGRREDRLVALQKQLQSTKTNVIIACFDVRNQIEVEKTIHSLDDKVKSQLAVLINNAGLAVGRNAIDEANTDDWERMIDTNIKGLLYVSKAVIPLLKNNQSGHIFNIASIAGKEVYPLGNVYCATKHAVDALSKSMRMELVDYNVKVTNIAPGAVETEFSLVRFKGNRQKADAIYKNYEPLVATDIADVIYFTASRPKHVTINDLTIMPTAQASASIFKK